jgi:hypothetical protein
VVDNTVTVMVPVMETDVVVAMLAEKGISVLLSLLIAEKDQPV